MALIQTLWAIAIFVVSYYVGRMCLNYGRYTQARKSLGCPPLPHYPHWDPILGLDFVYAMFNALWQHRFLEFQKESYSARGSKVWCANFLGNRMVYSSEPDNMKAMSTSHIDAFGVEPIRTANGAVTPFTGFGVNTSDGEKWQHSRNLVKPYFDRSGYTNLQRLGEHVDRLLSKIPTDGATVDMQPLFQRWVRGFLKCFLVVGLLTEAKVLRYVDRLPLRRKHQLFGLPGARLATSGYDHDNARPTATASAELLHVFAS